MREDVIQEYEKRVAAYQAEFEQADKQSQQLSYGRLAVFILGGLVSYFALSFNFKLGIFVSVAAVSGFLYIVKRHATLESKRLHFKNLKAVNQLELNAQAGIVNELEDGKEFVDPKHGYTFDLDIFGKRSVFQYINRTASVIGFRKLAGWFQGGFHEKSIIERRQDAIRDLAHRTDFRQDFLATGHESLENESGTETLESWLKEPFYYLPHPWYKYLIILLPALTILTGVLSIFVEAVTWHVPLVFILINFWIVRQNLDRVAASHAKLSRRARMLEKYSDLLHLIDREDFTSQYLQELKTRIARKGVTASESIGQLAAISKAFDNRLNVVAAFFLNGLILWDLQIMFRLEKWKQDARDEMKNWFDVLSEMDGLVSLGGFSYNHPEFIFPEVNEKNYVLNGEEIGHILLDPKKRVDNTLKLQGDGQYVIITGANMAGKSTFLRTVGVNLILAMIGAPVCAKKFEFRPIELATSVRATDSLQDNESYFYAELVRLKGIIDRLRDGERLFVIIDEMLRGTNSRDKQVGSRGFIEQLIHLNGMGLIATHDLSLGTLKDEYPDNIRNMRFEIEITGEQLNFDYKLQEGISQNLNATYLMEQMGIMEKRSI